MSEQHLDLLSMSARSRVSRCRRQLASHVTRGFVELPGDLPMSGVGAASGLEFTVGTVVDAAAIDQRIVRRGLAG